MHARNPTHLDWPSIIEQLDRAAARVVPAEHDRSDLVQDALLVLIRRNREGADDEIRPALLCTILRRLVIDRWRRRKPIAMSEDPAGSTEEPDARLRDADLSREVQDAIAALPPAQAVVVRLRHEEGLTFHEIAERLAIPRNTALGRMHLATAKLKRRLHALRTEGPPSRAS